MNLNQIRVFLVLADTLHFGRAAKQLGVTQPAVSRVLAALERQVGAELLDRTSRAVRLTPAGTAFQGPARRMSQAADAALRAARTGVTGGIDRLRVGLMVGAEQPAVGQLIRRFVDRHPETRIGLYHANETTLGRQLADGSIDAAVAWEASVASGLFRRRLARAPMSFLLPTGHRLARKRAIAFEDVRGEPIILPARELQPIIYESFGKLCRAAGFEPNVSVDVSSTGELLALVAAGVGVGNAPILPTLRYPGVVLRPNEPEFTLEYVLAWLDDGPAVRGLLEVM